MNSLNMALINWCCQKRIQKTIRNHVSHIKFELTVQKVYKVFVAAILDFRFFAFPAGHLQSLQLRSLNVIYRHSTSRSFSIHKHDIFT